MAITNEQLVRVLLRDREALFAYCWSILRNDDLAEEVFQELSALAVQKRETIVDEQHLAGWLRLAARNKAQELIRARGSAPTLLDDELLDKLETDWRRWDATPSATLLHLLRQCLMGLGESARELIDLRYGQGLKSAQVAEQMNRNVKSVYVALTRIHVKLGDCVRSKVAISG
jgi:RNA polymerase sigma-70 factor (ECF subfamily)